LLEALEDYVKRQRKRLTGAKAAVVEAETAAPQPAAPPSPAPGNVAKVAFMITQDQRAQLKQLGHDDDSINKMTPEMAHSLLGLMSRN